MLKKIQIYTLVLSLCLTLFQPIAAFSQGAVAEKVEKIDTEMNASIRKEAMEHSQILRTLHFLTDVYGPRLTGSPNQKAAADWAIKQMQAWGLENAHLEAWDFGHPGWLNEKAAGYLISPVKDNLTFEVLAWTPSTKGTVTGQAVQITLPDKPTKDELTAYLNTVKDKVKGKIVLIGQPQFVAVTLNPSARRLDDQDVKARYSPLSVPQQRRPQSQAATPDPNRLTAAQISTQLDEFLVSNDALVRINDAGREHGQIRAFHNRTYDVNKAVPTVVMRNEDFGRISRILADGTPVELEFNIVNRTYPEGRISYNAIAEIPGTDKKDEVVMLGGHLDSWHAATGATDNAIGCAVMMEAARILNALGVKPRRTIRIALWSGEEQGLLGSKAYVKDHFGSFEEPKADYTKLAGYFNIDSGTGRARGLSVFGPVETASVLHQVVAPFADLGVAGAVATKSRVAANSDYSSFNQVGLPGISVEQDPIEYGSATWHTNIDTYERVIDEDARKSAIVIAAAVYHLAMRDEQLPRFSKEQMPPVPGRQGTTPQAPSQPATARP